MTTLLIFQILGVVFTALGTAHKLVKGNAPQTSSIPQADSQYPDNTVEPSRLSLVKQLEWIFIIGGALTTIISFIIQSHNSQKASVRAQSQESNQLAIMGATLKGVYRIVTRFDRISFSVTYELPESNYFVPVFEKMFESSPLRFASLPPPDEPPLEPDTVYSSTVGLGYYLSNNIPIPYAWSDTETSFPLPLKDDLFDASRVEDTRLLRQAIDLFSKPQLSLTIHSRKHHSEFLHIESTNMLGPPLLIYRPNTHKVYIQWAFECPKEQWKQTKDMTSIPDLANARLTHSILKDVPDWLAMMMPVGARVRFDDTEMRIENFYRATPSLPPPTDLRVVFTGLQKETAKKPDTNRDQLPFNEADKLYFKPENLATSSAKTVNSKSFILGLFHSKMPDESELFKDQ